MVLLFGLVFMHHVPIHSGHDAALAAASDAAVGSGAEMPDAPMAACPCRAVDQLAVDHPAVDHSGPMSGGGPASTMVLHLCLAVLTALGGVLTAGLVLLAITSRAGGDLGPAGRRVDAGYLRPPLPVPRRLSTLGVLRL